MNIYSIFDPQYGQYSIPIISELGRPFSQLEHRQYNSKMIRAVIIKTIPDPMKNNIIASLTKKPIINKVIDIANNTKDMFLALIADILTPPNVNYYYNVSRNDIHRQSN